MQDITLRRDGKKYVYSIIINNYEGSGSTELQKIFKCFKINTIEKKIHFFPGLITGLFFL